MSQDHIKTLFPFNNYFHNKLVNLKITEKLTFNVCSGPYILTVGEVRPRKVRPRQFGPSRSHPAEPGPRDTLPANPAASWGQGCFWELMGHGVVARGRSWQKPRGGCQEEMRGERNLLRKPARRRSASGRVSGVRAGGRGRHWTQHSEGRQGAREGATASAKQG